MTGKVVDAATGAALVGAQVQLTPNGGLGLGFTTQTNAQGAYEFFDVTGGQYTLTATYNSYQVFSILVDLTGAGSQIAIPTIQLQFDYCGTAPVCSGHGHCGTGTFCICDEGYQGLGCGESILPPECASHRGFTEQVLDDVLIMSALDKNYNKLSNLLNSLESLSLQLPAYQSNSCCGGDDGFTYPIDVSMISTSSYAFLQSMMLFTEDSQAFLNEVHV